VQLAQLKDRTEFSYPWEKFWWGLKVPGTSPGSVEYCFSQSLYYFFNKVSYDAKASSWRNAEDTQALAANRSLIESIKPFLKSALPIHIQLKSARNQESILTL
jgi:hypothetical protein